MAQVLNGLPTKGNRLCSHRMHSGCPDHVAGAVPKKPTSKLPSLPRPLNCLALALGNRNLVPVGSVGYVTSGEIHKEMSKVGSGH